MLFMICINTIMIKLVYFLPSRSCHLTSSVGHGFRPGHSTHITSTLTCIFSRPLHWALRLIHNARKEQTVDETVKKSKDPNCKQAGKKREKSERFPSGDEANGNPFSSSST